MRIVQAGWLLRLHGDALTDFAPATSYDEATRMSEDAAKALGA